MPAPLTINCPTCQVKLKVKDESKLGKKIACPKCQTPFVVEAPEEKIEEVSDFVEDDDDLFDTLESSPRSSKTSEKRPAKRKQSAELDTEGIIGLGDMTREELHEELEQGAKFVIFQYCISILIMTFLRPSKIHFIPAGSSSFSKGIGYTFLTLCAGWWGFPWGPIYTIMAIATNLGGGKDVTDEVEAGLG